MALTAVANSYRLRLTAGDLNTVCDLFRTLSFGDMVRALPVYLRRVSAGGATASAASAYGLATVALAGGVALPDNAKASHVLRCTVLAGSTLGEYTAVAFGTTPSTTNVGVQPNGDIVFLQADCVTSADVTYLPEKLDVIELTLPVVPSTGVCTIPAAYASRAVLLMESEALAGTLAGKKIVLVPAASAVATTKSALHSTNKVTIWFATADAVTSCRVKLGLVPLIDVNALLESASAVI